MLQTKTAKFITQSKYGPTTRRKWQDFVEQQQKRKKVGGCGNAITDDIMEDQSKIVGDSPQSSSCATEQAPLPKFEVALLDDNDSEAAASSSPLKKKARRSYERKKEKTNRGRPRKSDHGGYPGHQRNPKLSEDAKEGIELMHRMTEAVSSGSNADMVLADFTHQNFNESHSKVLSSAPLNNSGPHCEVLTIAKLRNDGLMNMPFPKFAIPAAEGNESDDGAGSSLMTSTPSKYSNLNKFLNELRRVYENFLDTMHTPNFRRSLKSSLEKTQNELFISVSGNGNDVGEYEMKNKSANADLLDKMKEIDDSSNHPSSSTATHSYAENLLACRRSGRPTKAEFVERSRRILDAHKRLRQKCIELENEFAAINAEMERLVADYDAHEEEQDLLEHQQHQLHLQQQQQINRETVEQQKRQQRLLQHLQHPVDSTITTNNSASQQSSSQLDHLLRQLVQQQQSSKASQLQSGGDIYPPSQASSLFSPSAQSSNNIEQILMSDFAHHFASQQQQQVLQQQQQQSTMNPMISQLTNFIAAGGGAPSAQSNNAQSDLVQALLAAATVSNPTSNSRQPPSLSTLSPVVSQAAHNSPSSSLVAALAAASAVVQAAALPSPHATRHQQPSQLTPTQPQQSSTQMMQTFLSSLDLGGFDNVVTDSRRSSAARQNSLGMIDATAGRGVGEPDLGNDTSNGIMDVSQQQATPNIIDSSGMQYMNNAVAATAENLFLYQQQQQQLNNVNGGGLLTTAISSPMTPSSSSSSFPQFQQQHQLPTELNHHHQQQHQQTSTISMNSTLVSSTNQSASSAAATATATTPAYDSDQSTVAAVVAAVAAGAPKKPRSRSVRVHNNGMGSGGSKRGSVESKEPEDPEIERQIQSIVAKALEVDSAAKCAEKERKSRNGDKRKERSSTGSVNTSSCATSISTTGRKRTSGDGSASIAGSMAVMSPSHNNTFVPLSPSSSLSSLPGSSSAVTSPTLLATANQQQFSLMSSLAAAASGVASASDNLSLSSSNGDAIVLASTTVVPLSSPIQCKIISVTCVAPPPHSSPSTSAGGMDTQVTEQAPPPSDKYVPSFTQSSVSLAVSTIPQGAVDVPTCSRSSLSSIRTTISASSSSRELHALNSSVTAGSAKTNGQCVTNASTLASPKNLRRTADDGGNINRNAFQTTTYIPLSSKTVMENCHFTLPPLPLSSPTSGSGGAAATRQSSNAIQPLLTSTATSLSSHHHRVKTERRSPIADDPRFEYSSPLSKTKSQQHKHHYRRT